MKVPALIAFVATLIVSCDMKGLGRREAAVRQLEAQLRTVTAPEATAFRQFLTNWPGSLRHPSLGSKEAGFEGEIVASTLIEKRYAFVAILSYEMSGDYKTVTFPQVNFRLQEIKAIKILGDGKTISFTSNQHEIDLQKWNALVKSNFNFGAVGITVTSNAPVMNADLLKHTDL